MRTALVIFGAIAMSAQAANADPFDDVKARAIASLSSSQAAEVAFKYESFYLDKGRAKIILKVENNTAHPYKMVFAECAFLDGNKRAIDTATLIATNVSPGSSAYMDGWSAQIAGIEQASCRISSAR